MKKYILLMFLTMELLTARAQQDPLYAQYINNPLVLNPAVAGLNNDLTANVNYRSQWSSLPGSPKTLNASAAMSILNNTAGAGLIMSSDAIGNTTTTAVYAMGSYRIHLSKRHLLSFGLQAGMITYKIGNDKVTPYDTSDPYFQGTVSETKPSLGAGITLRTDNLEIGLSVPHMLRTTSNIDGKPLTLYNQHFYAYGAYKFFLSDRIGFKPGLLIKAVQSAPLSADINAAVIIDDKYQAGILTRNLNSYGLFGNARIKDTLNFGFVFEMPTGKSVGTNYSTFEIMLGLRIKALPFHTGY